MHKIVVLYPHPKSTEDFRQYYLVKHLPLAARLPGLIASRHAFDVEAIGGPSPYFAVWEGEFESAAAMGAAMASPFGQAVAADVPNYATGGCVILHYGPTPDANT